MTEYVIREIGPRHWLLLADRQGIAVCADESEAMQLMEKHSAANLPTNLENPPSRKSPAGKGGANLTEVTP